MRAITYALAVLGITGLGTNCVMAQTVADFYRGKSLFDPTKFTWIGSASREDGLCVATQSSGIASWNDLLEKEVIVGTTAPGTTTYMYPVMLRNLSRAKFKPVSGYPDAGQIALAVQRNEVQAICQTFSSIK